MIMGKTATGGGEPRELPPARTYLGIVNGVYDIGTQKGYGTNGPVSKFIVSFELHTRGNRKAGPQPARNEKGDIHEISEFVSFYLGSRERPSNLLALVEACEGRKLSDDEIKKGYDIEQLLGKHCQVVVGHSTNAKGGAIAKIESFAAPDPDDEEPTGLLDCHYFEIKGGSTDIPDFVPKWVVGQIKKSKEFGGDVSATAETGANGRQPAMAGAAVGADDDSIPF